MESLRDEDIPVDVEDFGEQRPKLDRKVSRTFERMSAKSQELRYSKRRSLGLPVEDEYYENGRNPIDVDNTQSTLSLLDNFGSSLLSIPTDIILSVVGIENSSAKESPRKT